MNVQELKELIIAHNKEIEAGMVWLGESPQNVGSEKTWIIATTIIIRNDLIQQLDWELQKESMRQGFRG